MDSATSPSPDGAPNPAPESGVKIAFQPIADTAAGRVWAYEAQLRGPNGENFDTLIAELAPEARADADRRAAVAAVRLAMRAGLGNGGARLCIPSHAPAIGNPLEHIQPAINAARGCGLIPERLIFSLHGYHQLSGPQLAEIVHVYGKQGCLTLFDGLGPDQEWLGTCGRYAPYAVKLEPELVGGIVSSWSRRITLESLTPKLRSLGLKVIATGVDTDAVFQRLPGFGIHMIQGERVASPQIGALPEATLRRAA
ncbi:EAL domain-containing protein [Sphingomonas sp. MMS12-HWE2-04]|uniref:EAL domain-containing protein n=1 Tax=Sphingomonas sp. MMS12-HWE2-04 TaxID=3234199 RepID=UPI0038505660